LRELVYRVGTKVQQQRYEALLDAFRNLRRDLFVRELPSEIFEPVLDPALRSSMDPRHFTAEHDLSVEK
jgi:hypothetical protein